jgi:hypothetical protein
VLLRIFIHEADWCKVCAPFTEWRADTKPTLFVACTRACKIRPKGQKHLSTVLTAVERWICVATRERSSSRPFRRASHLHGQTRQGRSVHTWTFHSLFDNRELLTRSFSLGKSLESAVLHKGPKAFVEGIRRQRPNKWRLRNWLVHVTTRHRTPVCQALFNRKQHGGSPPSPYSPNQSICVFFLFLEVRMQVKGIKIWGWRWDSS